MHHRTAFALALLLSLLGGRSTPALAESPTQTLKRVNKQEINRLLVQKLKPGSAAEKKTKEEVKKAVNSLLDFDELARLSLAKHWKSRTEKERTEFVRILKDLIERNYQAAQVKPRLQARVPV